MRGTTDAKRSAQPGLRSSWLVILAVPRLTGIEVAHAGGEHRHAVFETASINKTFLRGSSAESQYCPFEGNNPRSSATWGHHFAVGMINSAPLPMLCGQRCMMDFCRV